MCSPSGGMSYVSDLGRGNVPGRCQGGMSYTRLKSDRSLTRRSLTGRTISSDVLVWGHAFEKDPLTIGCGQIVTDSTQTNMLCWNLYFQRFTLSVSNINVVVCFSKITCHFLLVVSNYRTSKISDKTVAMYFGVHFYPVTVYFRLSCIKSYTSTTWDMQLILTM